MGVSVKLTATNSGIVGSDSDGTIMSLLVAVIQNLMAHHVAHNPRLRQERSCISNIILSEHAATP